MSGRRLGSGEIQRMRKLRSDGVKVSVIAERFGVHRGTVTRVTTTSVEPGAVKREHGTAKGYRQHRYHRDETCPPCREANSAETRGRADARYAALKALADKYRTEFLRLYEQEKAARGI